jgi:hypothetical protein
MHETLVADGCVLGKHVKDYFLSSEPCRSVQQSRRGKS